MAYVVCEPCVNCEYTECASVCPVDAFHRDNEVGMLLINPRVCIDCNACEPACPVKAIYPEAQVPDMWRAYIDLNAERSAVTPVIPSTAPLDEPKSREGPCKPVQ
jgi:ferredoxin